MDSLTDLQRFRIDEQALALAENAAVIRWRINLPPSFKEHDPSGPDSIVRLNLTIHNFAGDGNAAVIKMQESNDDPSDNNPPYPGAFESTFTDISGSSKTIDDLSAQNLEVEITKPYVQLYGIGPAQLRIQGHCLAPIDIIGINDGLH